MRFLQTGDWHLGKVFHEMPLIEEQEAFLKQIEAEIAAAQRTDEPYAALLVPGDIYDRAVPPAEASQLLSRFLYRMHDLFPELHLFLSAGNHDSAGRLAFAKELLDSQNIHICTDTRDFTKPVVLENGAEKVCVYQLPFLYPLAFASEGEDGGNLRSQEELYEYACRRIREAHDKQFADIPSVLCAHLFAADCEISSSERSYVGAAEAVSAGVLRGFTYCALGHIHRCQSCGAEKRAYYSGSPLAYDFGDNPDTFFLSITLCGADIPSVQKIPVKPLHKIAVLEGRFSDFYGQNVDSALIETYRECFVKIVLTDSVIIQGAMALVRTNFPLCLTIVQKSFVSENAGSSAGNRKSVIGSKNPEKILEQFLSDAYGSADYAKNLSDEEKKCVQDEKKLFVTLTDGVAW